MPIDVVSSVARVATSLVARGIATSLKRIKIPRLPILRTHNKELVASLSRMPFIYKDLTTMVLKDFVQVKMEAVDPASLEPKKIEDVVRVSTDQRIKNRRKALFVGNAGIGKTTFFRYTVLSLVTSSQKIDHFFPDERLVPFYIPLKVVDNTKPFPVLNYLLSAHQYLQGSGGVRRLGRLARQRRLFLLLDGYDEIYVPPQGQQNFLLDELNILMADHAPVGAVATLYADVKNCRVWLSTRREFYVIHPLDLNEQRDRMSGPLGAVALSISGLHNRSLLVNKIFDIYRSRADLYKEKLSEESFLQDIDLSGDDELIELSFSPLFLTVMCYIHAQNLGAGIDDQTDYRKYNMSQLILTCIDLLLEDLDEYRVRDVPMWQREVFREAFQKRRSLYTQEKKEFLAFFASRLLSRGLPVFDEAEITEAAREFFRIEYRGSRAEEILRGLEARHRSEHNFVRQLLNQGVFVLVPKTGDAVLYDFPHRRFREVLAARYLDNVERLDVVMENFHKSQYAEFVYVFFSVSRFQNQILEGALERSNLSANGRHFGSLIYNCLKVKPGGYDASPILLNFIRGRIEGRQPFQLPSGVLDYLFLDKETVRWLAQHLRDAIAAGDRHIFAIAGPVLLRVNKALLVEILTSEFGAALALEQRSIWYLFARLLADADPDILFKRAVEFRANLPLFRVWLHVCSSLDRSGHFVRAVKDGLSFDRKVALVDVVQERSPGLLARFDHTGKLYDELEILSVLVRSIRHPELRRKRESRVISDLSSGTYAIHIVTRSVILCVADTSMQERLRNLMGQVLSAEEFAEDKFPYGYREEILRRSRHSRNLWKKINESLRKQKKAEDDDIIEYFY